MKKSVITAVLTVLVIGGGLTAWKLGSHDSSKQTTTLNSQTSSNTKSAMQKQYEGYKGEKYDRMFLAGMMAHHQGAIDMANLALTSAQHQEVKDMAHAIVSAQTSEMSEMQTWQKQWGYPATSGANMQDHGAMAMENEMAGMVNDLKGKTGDEFDKAFLSGMIAHHQEAIDMSTPAVTNAYHQEVKTLASNIITAQTHEISQMRNWQTLWGYKNQSSSSDNMPGMNM